MLYYLIDNGIDSVFTKDELIEAANERKAEENAQSNTYPKNKPYPDMSLNEAIEFFKDRDYDIILGEWL